MKFVERKSRWMLTLLLEINLDDWWYVVVIPTPPACHGSVIKVTERVVILFVFCLMPAFLLFHHPGPLCSLK